MTTETMAVVPPSTPSPPPRRIGGTRRRRPGHHHVRAASNTHTSSTLLLLLALSSFTVVLAFRMPSFRLLDLWSALHHKNPSSSSSSFTPSFRTHTHLLTRTRLGPSTEPPPPPPSLLTNKLTNKRPPPTFISRLIRRLEKADIGLIPTTAFLAQAALIGLGTGLSIITFKTLISMMETYTYGNFLTSALNAFGSGKPLAFSMALIPAIGGLLVGIIRETAREFPPGLSGQIDDVDKQKPLNIQRALLKSLAAVVTLGSGCSLGPEGPAVELGVVTSRIITSKVSVEQRRQLLSAGAAAGVAAGFNAPIAGVFFALEIAAQGTSNSDDGSGSGIQKSTLAAILLAAVTSALVARVGLKEELALRPAAYVLSNPLVELPAYLGLGILSGLVALLFRYLCTKSDDFFKGNLIPTTQTNKQGGLSFLNFMAKVPRFYKPIIGGAICGLTGILFPQVLFFGYETLDGLIANEKYPAGLLLGLLGLKSVMTAICLGSGLVGGLFAPSLFLGATAGAAYQKLVSAVLQLGVVGTLIPIAGPPAYAMVGAASVLASMFRAPLTGSLLLFELTRDYDILLPLMASAGMGSLLVELVERKRKVDEAEAAEAAAALLSASQGSVIDVHSSTISEAMEENGGGSASNVDDQAVAVDILGTILTEITNPPVQAIEEGIVLPGASMGGGGRSEQLVYKLQVLECMGGGPLVLPPSTPLEEALLRLCAEKAEVVMVVGGREGVERGGGIGEEELVGVAMLKDLMAAMERWYDERQQILSRKRERKRGSSSSSSSSLPAAVAAAVTAAREPALIEDTDFEVLQGALSQVVATVDAAERAQALAEVVRQLKWSTGLTLEEVVVGGGAQGQGLGPKKDIVVVYAEDKAIKARDLLTTRGLSLLPVIDRKRREGKEGGGKVLGVVDLASIRAAVARRETVEMVSRSVVDNLSSTLTAGAGK